MSFVGPRILRSVLQMYFVTFLRARGSSDVRFAYAIDILKAFSLIQAGPSLYAIHPFTQAVLRQEFDSRLEVRLFAF